MTCAQDPSNAKWRAASIELRRGRILSAPGDAKRFVDDKRRWPRVRRVEAVTNGRPPRRRESVTSYWLLV